VSDRLELKALVSQNRPLTGRVQDFGGNDANDPNRAIGLRVLIATGGVKKITSVLH
jgi:hypothetical protein